LNSAKKLTPASDASIEEVSQVLEKNAEDAVDWQWLSLFDSVKVNVNINEARWSKSSFDNNKLSVAFNQAIEFSLDSTIKWLESEAFYFNDTVELVGRWQPTAQRSQGADLTGKLALITSAAKINVDGDINVNGWDGNKLLASIESVELPTTVAIDKQTKLLIEQYFPLKAVLNIEQIDQMSKLIIQEARFGKSDISGDFNLSPTAKGYGIKAQFESQLLSYQSFKNDTKEKKERTLEPLPQAVESEASSEVQPGEEKKTDSKKVFSNQAIDWSWLDSLLIDFD